MSGIGKHETPKVSIYKTRGMWHARFVLFGEQRRVSMGTDDEAAARKMLADYEAGHRTINCFSPKTRHADVVRLVIPSDVRSTRNQTRKRQPHSFDVYVLLAVGLRYFKIGYSQHVGQRAREIGHHLPMGVEVLWSRTYAREAEALWVESNLHYHFDAWRTVRDGRPTEWFALPDESTIADTVAEVELLAPFATFDHEAALLAEFDRMDGLVTARDTTKQPDEDIAEHAEAANG